MKDTRLEQGEGKLPLQMQRAVFRHIKPLADIAGWAAHSHEMGQLHPSTSYLWRDSPGGAHASLTEENAEMEAKLCPGSTGAAIAAERQG